VPNCGGIFTSAPWSNALKTLFFRMGPFQATWFLSVSLGRTQPQRDKCRLHGFLHHGQQVLTRFVQPVEAPQTPVQDVSAKEAIWLFVRNPADLDETEQETLTALCQASETARTIYQLVQEFRYLLHHRQGEKLDNWLEKVRLG